MPCLPSISLALADSGALAEEDARVMVNEAIEEVRSNGMTPEDGLINGLQEGDALTYRPGQGWEMTPNEEFKVSGVPHTSHLRNGLQRARKRGLLARILGRD